MKDFVKLEGLKKNTSEYLVLKKQRESGLDNKDTVYKIIHVVRIVKF